MVVIRFCGYVMQCFKPVESEFKNVDKNKDGRISINEFNLYYMDKYGKMPDLRTWLRFHLADKDCDGYINIQDIYAEDPQKNLFWN